MKIDRRQIAEPEVEDDGEPAFVLEFDGVPRAIAKAWGASRFLVTTVGPQEVRTAKGGRVFTSSLDEAEELVLQQLDSFPSAEVIQQRYMWARARNAEVDLIQRRFRSAMNAGPRLLALAEQILEMNSSGSGVSMVGGLSSTALEPELTAALAKADPTWTEQELSTFFSEVEVQLPPIILPDGPLPSATGVRAQ